MELNQIVESLRTILPNTDVTAHVAETGVTIIDIDSKKEKSDE